MTTLEADICLGIRAHRDFCTASDDEVTVEHGMPGEMP